MTANGGETTQGTGGFVRDGESSSRLFFQSWMSQAGDDVNVLTLVNSFLIKNSQTKITSSHKQDPIRSTFTCNLILFFGQAVRYTASSQVIFYENKQASVFSFSPAHKFVRATIICQCIIQHSTEQEQIITLRMTIESTMTQARAAHRIVRPTQARLNNTGSVSFVLL